MATSATLRSARFRTLLAREAGDHFVHLQACTGLADAIERHDPGDAALTAVIERHCAPLRAAGVDAVALGCTHYPLVIDEIQRALGAAVRVIDTSDAVAEQAARQLGHTSTDATPRTAVLETTGDTERLYSLACHWLEFGFIVQQAPAALR